MVSVLACELCFSIDKEDEYSWTWDGQNQKLNLAIQKPIKKPINPLGGEIEKGKVLKYMQCPLRGLFGKFIAISTKYRHTKIN